MSNNLTFVDQYGLTVQQQTDGSWLRSDGVVLGSCDQDQAERIFAGMSNQPVANSSTVSTQSTVMSTADFLARFTPSESTAIIASSSTNMMIHIWFTRLATSSVVDLSQPQTQADLKMLVSTGLLEESRISEILTISQIDAGPIGPTGSIGPTGNTGPVTGPIAPD